MRAGTLVDAAILLLAVATDALSVGVLPRQPAATPSSPAAGGGETPPPPARVPLLSTTPEELREALGWAELPHKRDRARIVWGALRRGVDVLAPHEADLAKQLSPKLLRELAPACESVCSGTVLSETRSEDGTQKLLLSLRDGLSVECVLLPMSETHTSLCVSSQVGCARGCAFCSTGAMGMVRSLSANEILSQVWLALRRVREQRLPPLTSVVMMGMGEPLDNLDAVAVAARLLVHPDAFALSPRSVCVSTVGPSPALIHRAVAELPCRMAWSVHAAADPLRRALVPTTRHAMADLRDAFADALALRPLRLRPLLVELALIGGVNDSPSHADELADFLSGSFDRSTLLLNLIPYNDNALGVENLGGRFVPPDLDDVRAFQRRLWERGFRCTVRATRGDEEKSACGMLATEAARR